MAFTKLTNHIDQLSEDIQAYLKSMLEYYKLDAFKKTTNVTSLLIKILVIGSILIFFLGFISTAFAILIGNAIGMLSTGFFIVGGFYFLVFIGFLIFGKKVIDRIVLRKFSKQYFKEDDDENDVYEHYEE